MGQLPTKRDLTLVVDKLSEYIPMGMFEEAKTANA